MHGIYPSRTAAGKAFPHLTRTPPPHARAHARPRARSRSPWQEGRAPPMLAPLPPAPPTRPQPRPPARRVPPAPPPPPPPRARALAPALGGVQHAYLWPHIVSRDRIGAPPCRDRIGWPAAGGLGSAHVQRQDRRILVQRQDRVARRRRIRVRPCPETG